MRLFVVLILVVLAMAMAHSKSKSNSKKTTTVSKTLSKAELHSNLRVRWKRRHEVMRSQRFPRWLNCRKNCVISMRWWLSNFLCSHLLIVSPCCFCSLVHWKLQGSNTEMQCITELTYANYSDQQCADACDVTSTKTKCNSYEVKCVKGGDCTCYLYRCSPVSF